MPPKYTNPFSDLPEIQYAKNVFQKDEQAASELAYNSPAEQVKRLRAAGLNPDLQNVTAGDSGTSPSVTPSALPQNDGASQTDAILGMSQAFMQSIPTAISLVQEIKANNLNLQNMELDLVGKADSMARQEIATQLTLPDVKDKHSYPQLYLGHYSKRTRKRIQNAIDLYVRDPYNTDIAEGLVYDKKSRGQIFRKGYLDIISQSGFSLDDETFVKVLKEYNDVVRSASKNKSSYDSTYYGNLNGKTRADAENASHNKQGLEAQNDVMPQLFARANSLMDSDKRGERGAGILLYVLTTLLQSKVAALGK